MTKYLRVFMLCAYVFMGVAFGKDSCLDAKLDYSELITNYHLKEEVNAVFNKYVSYDDMTSDLKSFNAAIGDISGIRTIQSFANKIAAKWNK